MVTEHGPMVWRTAYRLLGNRADADECLQDAFSEAVATSRRQSVANWPGLLRRIATQRAIDRLRRRTSDVLRGPGEAHLDQSVSPECSPDRAVINRELSAELRCALQQLPQRDAEVVCMRFLNELSYEQIAKDLSISVGHVGMILSRAREKLRSLLQQRGADHG